MMNQQPLTPKYKRKYLLDLIRAANEISRHTLNAEFQIVKKFKTGNLQIQLESATSGWVEKPYDLKVTNKKIFGNPIIAIRNAEKRHPLYADRPYPYWTYFHESNLANPVPDSDYLGCGEALLRLTWKPISD